MKLIIKGDDLGWTDGVNAGFEKAARDGILTSAGCMPNMPAAKRGIEMLQKYPHVDIGQHTSIVIGKPVCDPKKIPHLVDENGNFNSSRYYRELSKTQEDVLPYYDEIYLEVEAQLNHFIEMAGCKPAYLEGHAIPSKTFEKVLEDVAEKYDIVNMNPFGENKYGLYIARSPGYMMNIFKYGEKCNQYELDAISYIVNDEANVLKHELAMMFFHPGFVDADIVEMSSFTGIRACDVKALCSDEVKNWVKKNNVQLINHLYLRGL